MQEMFIKFNKNGSDYELSTMGYFLKITRDGKIIHVQFKAIHQQQLLDLGLKSLSDIMWNIGEYIEFCEAKKVYKGISFESDEWERHTKIYVKFTYASEDGVESFYKSQIDSVQGNMRGTCADRLIDDKYYPFVSCSLDEDKVSVPWSREKLRQHLMAESRKKIYNV
ncbi:hypothetical protein [Bacillus rhizoplanae]|uniref:hypothetical protein n=1 Tax=Bacillus rhizoplanae TaxID=2880966 RepID=UPI003D20211B